VQLVTLSVLITAAVAKKRRGLPARASRGDMVAI
jgi:hypothetical protein